MKFVYEFRTSDNIRHGDVISAADRDAAYRILKERGIRPSRLVEAPGILNKALGKGKRWAAIVVLTGLVAASAFVTLSTKRTILAVERQLSSAMPRHQIPALPPGWSRHLERLFPDKLDQLLARHAQPGIIVQVHAFEPKSAPLMEKSPALEELGRVVMGMRQEAKGFLALGKSIDDLERFLGERQHMEADYRARTLHLVRSGGMGIEEANETLLAMELKPIGREEARGK